MTAPALPIAKGNERADAMWPCPPVPSSSVIPLYRTADGTAYTVIRFSNATGTPLRVQLGALRLPRGAELFVYGIDTAGAAHSVQNVERSGPVYTGRFVSSPIVGDIVVEYQPGDTPDPDMPFQVEGFIPQSTDPGTATPDVQPTQSPARQDIRQGWYRGSEITYEVEDGVAVFEGDIILGDPDALHAPSPSKTNRRLSYGIAGAEYRWPSGTIPYSIDATLPMQSRVTAAVAHWNTVLQGVVRLVPRTNEKNYVYFTAGSGCSSSVGMIGMGRQNIYLAASCSTGNAIHEIGHAFGLWHEHTRMDRDAHVKVFWENILAGYAYNFYQEYNGLDLGTYDYNSIMHYPAWAFSANGKPTIETIPAGIPIGQSTALSAGDIGGIQALYAPAPAQVSTVSVNINTNPSGLALVVDGVTVTAPYSAAWVPDTIHTVGAPDQSQTGMMAQFVAWTDAGAQTHTVTTPSSAVSLVANYAQSYLLSVQSAGPGTVAAVPVSDTGYYPASTLVALTASANSDACFAGWTGFLNGTPSATTVTVTKPYTVTAEFMYGAYTLARTSLLLSSRRQVTSSVSVSATGGCVWTAASNAAWITVISGTSYTGSSAVKFTVGQNDTGVTRTGTLTIAGQTFTVRQPAR